MKILVDIIPFDGGKSGISAYAKNVVRELVEMGHEVTLLAESGVPAEFFPGMKAIEAPRWVNSAAKSMAWHLFFAPRLVKKSGCAACLILAANRRAFRKYPIPTVAVVHDLSQYHVKAKYDAARMFYVKKVLPFFVRRAHRIVAISKSTARDLVEYWHVPEERIRVVYDGFTPPRTVERPAREGEGSILYVSRIEHPGKNHETLIKAYSLLPDEFAAAHHLVLAGSDWNGAEEVHKLAEASRHSKYIEFPGFVPDADLPSLYASAAVYVFPSRFEGFGLSLIEAMSAGVPTACSGTSSLGEIGEGASAVFDPESPEEIASAILAAAGECREELIAAGKTRAAQFGWRKCAEELLGAFPEAEVFGVKLDTVTMQDAVAEVAAAKRGAAGAPRFFAFANAHCLNVSCTDSEYAEILKTRCDRVWPDGSGVRMAGAMKGFPVPENVNGTDLFPELCRAISVDDPGKRRSVFFFGGIPGVAEAAAENAKKACPGLEVAGTCDGFRDAAEVVRLVNASKCDILLVALGVPLQEKWIAARLGELDVGAAVAVGGLLDFVSGRHARAPGWMRKHGIEWLHRLWLEPVRMFRRYVVGNPLFLARVWRDKRKSDKRRVP